ncbi:MAG: F0F1 ATP synthase subunit B [Propionibacteriaceae bacterium]|nr:F0F1 ATP synthase subunit B [Propionibacteriaceae bacterium]
MLPLEGPNLGPLLPEHMSEIFVGIALFLVVWYVVQTKVVPVFEKTYAERTEVITGGIEKAEAAQNEAAAALAEYKAQLAWAREEASRIREEAKGQAASIAAEIREQAQAESARMIATAKAQIEAERAQVVHQLRGEVGGLATTLAGRIVGESLEDDERARRSVERFIADLEAQTETESV